MLIALFIAAWGLFGFLSFIGYCISTGTVTVEDVLVAFLCAFLGPIAMLIAIANLGHSIVLWRRK